MIPKKAPWVQFPARVSTFCSKLIFNQTCAYICSYKCLYRISNQEISCSAMPYKFCNFSSMFSSFYVDLAIPRKIPFLVYLYKIVDSGYKNNLIRNTISLSRREQVCLIRVRFERYFSHHRAR